MPAEVTARPSDGLVELEYTLQVRTSEPVEETRILRVHHATREEAESARQEMFDAGLVGADVDVLCRKVSRWQQVPV